MSGTDSENLSIAAARQAYSAVLRHPSFSLVEFRVLNDDLLGESEIVIVDAECHRVPQKNPLGIRFRERIALRFFRNSGTTPEVRALRVGFPEHSPHQNYVEAGTPPSLCLYSESWNEVVRTWTVQKHLNRVLEWLEYAALGELHRTDEPVERLFFDPQCELVLPHDFEALVANPNLRVALDLRDSNLPQKTLVARAVARNQPINTPKYSCVALKLPPVVQGRVEEFSRNLGDLEDRLATRGASFMPQVFADIRARFAGGTVAGDTDEQTILLLDIPITRSRGGPIEARTIQGYLIEASVQDLGLKGGQLDKHERQVVVRILGPSPNQDLSWRDIRIFPLAVHQPFTPEIARKVSGLTEAGPRAVLAGVGALGSALFNLWSRSGWGRWTLIDPDGLKPHNLGRHTAYESHLGSSKVEAVCTLDAALWGGRSVASGIPANAMDFGSPAVGDALRSADLVIDATTTLGFPREYASKLELPRGMSVFLTPNGAGSVLLAEDKERKIPLDALEAQYYRLILSRPWGENHLAAHEKYFRSGASCRDLSSTMPLDRITVHAGVLAHQIRQAATSGDAHIRVWHYDQETGSMASDSALVEDVRQIDLIGFTVLWDAGIQRKLRGWRADHLPAETGGVLLGYFDLTKKNIYVVDALPAPADSDGDSTGFSRGTEGLMTAVSTASGRTGQVVGYVGEWHSHPQHASTRASKQDLLLLADLANQLDEDGLPALMLIVGEVSENWYLAHMEAACRHIFSTPTLTKMGAPTND